MQSSEQLSQGIWWLCVSSDKHLGQHCLCWCCLQAAWQQVAWWEAKAERLLSILVCFRYWYTSPFGCSLSAVHVGSVLSLLHPRSVGISVGSFVIWVHSRYMCRALRTAHAWVAPPHHMLHSLMSCWKGGAGHHSIGLQHAELPAIYGTFLWTRMIQVLMPFSSFFKLNDFVAINFSYFTR